MTDLIRHEGGRAVAHIDDALATSMLDVAGGSLDLARLAVEVGRAFDRVPSLRKTTPESQRAALLELAATGLLPDGVEAALVPYKSECRAMPMWQGLVRLLYAEGVITSCDAAVVYDGEPFRVRRGTSAAIEHEQRFDVRRTDDRIVAVYAVLTLPDGSQVWDVLGRDEIEKVRSSSRAGTYSDSPWSTWWDRMAIKTAVRRAAKLVPRAPRRFLRALEADNAAAGVVVDGEARSSRPARVSPVELARERRRKVQERAAARAADEVVEQDPPAWSREREDEEIREWAVSIRQADDPREFVAHLRAKNLPRRVAALVQTAIAVELGRRGEDAPPVKEEAVEELSRVVDAAGGEQ